MNKILLALFIASLPACYFTITPSVLLFALLVLCDAESSFIEYMDALHRSDLAIEVQEIKKRLDETKAEFEKLQTQVSKLNLKAGFSLQ